MCECMCGAVNGSRKPKSEDCKKKTSFHNITTGALTISCVCTLREIKIIFLHRTQAHHRIFRDFRVKFSENFKRENLLEILCMDIMCFYPCTILNYTYMFESKNFSNLSHSLLSDRTGQEGKTTAKNFFLSFILKLWCTKMA